MFYKQRTMTNANKTNKHNVQENDLFVFTNSYGLKFTKRVRKVSEKSVFLNGFTQEGKELVLEGGEGRLSWTKFNAYMDNMQPVQVS